MTGICSGTSAASIRCLIRKPDGSHAVSVKIMMLKLGGRIGLADVRQVGGDGGALLGCFDCRRLLVVSLLGAIPPEVRT